MVRVSDSRLALSTVTEQEVNVGLLLFLPYRAMEARVFEGLAAAGFDDLTPAQARVFQRIAPGG